MSNQLGSLKMGQKFKKTPAGEIPVDWDVFPIKDLALKLLNGGTPDRSNEKYWEGKIPWISGADFGDQKVAVVRRHITKEAVENSATNIIPKGALLVVTRTGVGKLAVAPFDLTISQDITGLLPNAKYTSSEFLFWMLNFHIAKLKANHQGTSISGVLREDLESFPIPVPAITEQNKITGILSAVSSVEEKANAEIENSKTLKKGLMRQLLTRGIGHKKFKKTPVGEIPATWEVMSVKALAEAMLNGGTPDTTNKTFWSGTIPWISGADFLNQKIDAYRRYITPEAVNNSTTNIVPKGALLVVTRTGVGKLAIAPVDIAISQDITGIIPKASLISAGFMFWMLNLRIGKLKANHQGTSINGILREDLESFMLPIPPLWEQEKITRILMDCDDSLRKHELCLTKLTILKKSLMKMLLTGKVRVIEYAR